MSKNNRIRNYVLFTLRWSWDSNKYVWYPTKYSWSGLIHSLAIIELYKNSDNSSVLNNLASRLDDMSCRYYVCKVIDNKVYDIDYIKLTNDFTAELERVSARRAKLRKAREARQRAMKFKFRNGSVPGIHKYKGHRGSYYRRPQLNSVRKSSEVVEYMEFRKPKDRCVNLPLWDDRVRHNDKCWKTSYKVRKQWQKHLKHKDR
jgi:hypothetical protein